MAKLPRRRRAKPGGLVGSLEFFVLFLVLALALLHGQGVL